MHVWIYGFMDLKLCRYMDYCIYRFMDIWICGYMQILMICGYTYICTLYLCGFLDVWIHNFMGGYTDYWINWFLDLLDLMDLCA